MIESIKTILPVILALVTLVGGAIVYGIQRAVDRKNQLRAERREIYRRLVSCFNELNVHIRLRHNPEVESPFEKYVAYKGIEAEALVCSPDEVVFALKNLSEAIVLFSTSSIGSDPPDAELSIEFKDAYDKAVEAMRDDVLGKSKVGLSEIAEFSTGVLGSLGRFPL